MKHKHFYVVTYDIGDDKRRNQVVKLMESIGTRMNYSVFECTLTDVQYRNMCKRLERLIVLRQNSIYPRHQEERTSEDCGHLTHNIL